MDGVMNKTRLVEKQNRNKEKVKKEIRIKLNTKKHKKQHNKVGKNKENYKENHHQTQKTKKTNKPQKTIGIKSKEESWLEEKQANEIINQLEREQKIETVTKKIIILGRFFETSNIQ